ncbi:MAG: DAK2 domain-containing protein [Ruminococcaceae bacterium]|nr:DAK2 domain-containing protein [Oscillospiraceae bacterium]
MTQVKKLDGIIYAKMLHRGALRLHKHKEEINNLNVFPIPDGDTGDNMFLTFMGGVEATKEENYSLGTVARKAADGMLLCARGNSGVILSQFFDGIAKGLEGVDEADITTLQKALDSGVKHAYSAVMKPTEGTILTVARDAVDYANQHQPKTVEGLFTLVVDEAKRALGRTPDLLPTLKQAGVVDSGGAGLIYILRGMRRTLIDGEEGSDIPLTQAAENTINPDLFTEDSVLEYGYCTELLVRLQNAKTDIAAFNVNTITDFLTSVGDSVAAVKTGSMLKLHVHTKTPDKVLCFCQQFGEFLKIKIENMSLQHNNTIDSGEAAKPAKQDRKPYGVVVAACGAGIQRTFCDIGADVIVDGGQSMNPSSEDFLSAFDTVNAEVIFVFPNNSNVIMAAKQAAQMYKDADVRVIESKNIGEGYAALSMLDTSSNNTDAIVEDLYFCMEGVVTAGISKSIRDADMGVAVHAGDYIGFIGKDILCADESRKNATTALIDNMDLSSHDILIFVYGKDTDTAEVEFIQDYIEKKAPSTELYTINGEQDIYSYILIAE